MIKRLANYTDWDDISSETKLAAEALVLHSLVECKYNSFGDLEKIEMPLGFCPYYKGTSGRPLFVPESLAAFESVSTVLNPHDVRISVAAKEGSLIKLHACVEVPDNCPYPECPIYTAAFLQNVRDAKNIYDEKEKTLPISSEQSQDITDNEEPDKTPDAEEKTAAAIENVSGIPTIYTGDVLEATLTKLSRLPVLPKNINFIVTAEQSDEIHSYVLKLIDQLSKVGIAETGRSTSIKIFDQATKFTSSSIDYGLIEKLEDFDVVAIEDIELLVEGHKEDDDKSFVTSQEKETLRIANTIRQLVLDGKILIFASTSKCIDRFLKTCRWSEDLFTIRFDKQTMEPDDILQETLETLRVEFPKTSFDENELREHIVERQQHTDLTGKEISLRTVSNVIGTWLRTGEAKLDQPDGMSKEKLLVQSTAKLNEMIGLEGVKNQVEKYVAYTNFSQELTSTTGKTLSMSNHLMFTGNPGTGKTAVARIVADILYASGIVPQHKFKEVSARDLIGGYVGQTAIKTGKVLEEARGGVLFIDEAYSLFPSGSGDHHEADYGDEAIAEIIKDMEKYQSEFVIIFAGYQREMNNLINSNPGFRSRIGYIIHFPDYTTDELMQIFDLKISQSGLMISEDARDNIHDTIDAARNREHFGNGRYIDNFIRDLVYQHAYNRPDNLADQLDTRSANWKFDEISAFDVAGIDSIRSETGVREALAELNSLIGLQTIKDFVDDLTAALRFSQELDDRGIDTEPSTYHMVFTGNPGTGKTTVARLMAKILYGFGIVAEDKMVEAKAADFIASYLGQTPKKTKDLIASADGGVLFVDEAYALGQTRDYGQEAIDTLVAEMENRRKSMVIIFAGYTQDMKRFLDTNPGLRSRISHTLNFPDYSVEELLEILEVIAKKNSMKFTPEAKEAALAIFKSASKDEGFGNGRYARKLFEELQTNHARNLGGMDMGDAVTTDQLLTIDIDDFDNEQLRQMEGLKKNRIGFN